jgi:hypothetical protein
VFNTTPILVCSELLVPAPSSFVLAAARLWF